MMIPVISNDCVKILESKRGIGSVEHFRNLFKNETILMGSPGDDFMLETSGGEINKWQFECATIHVYQKRNRFIVNDLTIYSDYFPFLLLNFLLFRDLLVALFSCRCCCCCSSRLWRSTAWLRHFQQKKMSSFSPFRCASVCVKGPHGRRFKPFFY